MKEVFFSIVLLASMVIGCDRAPQQPTPQAQPQTQVQPLILEMPATPKAAYAFNFQNTSRQNRVIWSHDGKGSSFDEVQRWQFRSNVSENENKTILVDKLNSDNQAYFVVSDDDHNLIEVIYVIKKQTKTGEILDAVSTKWNHYQVWALNK